MLLLEAYDNILSEDCIDINSYIEECIVLGESKNYTFSNIDNALIKKEYNSKKDKIEKKAKKKGYTFITSIDNDVKNYIQIRNDRWKNELTFIPKVIDGKVFILEKNIKTGKYLQIVSILFKDKNKKIKALTIKVLNTKEHEQSKDVRKQQLRDKVTFSQDRIKENRIYK